AVRKLLYSVLNIILLRTWHVKREIRKVFKTTKLKKVLDAGSGPGQYSYYIAKKFGAEVEGVDVIKKEVERCNRFAEKEALTNLRFAVADLSDHDFSESTNEKYDLIISVDVMEHIKDDIAVFKNFAVVLRQNGKVIISTPSAGNTHDDEKHSFVDEHFREGYSPEDISTKLAVAGLHVDKIGFTYGFGGNVYWRLIMKVPVTLLNKSSFYFAVLPLYYLVAFPLSLPFMAIDYFLPPKRGGGLLVVAHKDS
ncbi:MAG: class I SAM-dependent methyltransferase, partial [Candidatus Kryptoniota bacterium]